MTGAKGQEPSKTQQVAKQVEETKDIMKNNIQILVDNMEQIDLINEKSEKLLRDSSKFKKLTVDLKRKMWCKNAKCTVFVLLLVILGVGIIAAVIAVELNK